jgi:maltose alpha-D-glucosyltransferase/alpha-amylase
MGGFFMKAYLDTVGDNHFVPADKTDFRVMIQTFLLEKSLLDLNHALSNGMNNMVVPMRTIRLIIN